MSINRFYSLILAFAWLGAMLAQEARPEAEPWPLALRRDMARLAEVEWRLRVAADNLCPRKSMAIGLRIDHLGAYAQDDKKLVEQVLGLPQAPQVAVVVKGSPADRAGIMPGDALLAIDGEDVGQLAADASRSGLLADEIERRLAMAPAGMPVVLQLLRAGEERRIVVHPLMLCATRYVLKTEAGRRAWTDGNEIAVFAGMIRAFANDDELALIAGHELGHIIARDPAPRSLAERRRMEDRADALGAALAHCAGYDVRRALGFWERYARHERRSWLHRSTHRKAADRARRLSKLLPGLKCPVTPVK